MSDYTNTSTAKISRVPGSDFFLCPCCGEESAHYDRDDGITDDTLETAGVRVLRLIKFFEKYEPSWSAAKRAGRAALMVTSHMEMDYINEHNSARELPERDFAGRTVRHGTPQVIYFMQGVSGGAIKIGIAVDVEKRRKAIQYFEPLEILATVPGNEKVETELHKQFASIRLHGEWFEPAPELLECIEHVRLCADLPRPS